MFVSLFSIKKFLYISEDSKTKCKIEEESKKGKIAPRRGMPKRRGRPRPPPREEKTEKTGNTRKRRPKSPKDLCNFVLSCTNH